MLKFPIQIFILVTFPAIKNHTFSLFSKFIKYQAYERERMFRPTNWTTRNVNPPVISPYRPIITKATYDQISTHIICAFNTTIYLVKETTESTLYEKIEKLLKMRNKLF